MVLKEKTHATNHSRCHEQGQSIFSPLLFSSFSIQHYRSFVSHRNDKYSKFFIPVRFVFIFLLLSVTFVLMNSGQPRVCCSDGHSIVFGQNFQPLRSSLQYFLSFNHTARVREAQRVRRCLLACGYDIDGGCQKNNFTQKSPTLVDPLDSGNFAVIFVGWRAS